MLVPFLHITCDQTDGGKDCTLQLFTLPLQLLVMLCTALFLVTVSYMYLLVVCYALVASVRGEAGYVCA